MLCNSMYNHVKSVFNVVSQLNQDVTFLMFVIFPPRRMCIDHCDRNYNEWKRVMINVIRNNRECIYKAIIRDVRAPFS